MNMMFSQLSQLAEGKLLQMAVDGPITELATDSRRATAGPGTVFFAIKGERNDGHRYIDELYQKGVRQFVVEQAVDWQMLPEANVFLAATHAVDVLQRVAAARRAAFTLPVVAITGSNGKTIVKEWLTQMLSPFKRIVKSPKSYNSQIGVPLSVWQIDSFHDLGIFEAGISLPGEMARLEKVIRPDIGIFTNIGPAHDENFTFSTQKIREKIHLFEHCHTIICRAEHSAVIEELMQAGFADRLFIWSSVPGTDAALIVHKTDHRSLLISKGKEQYSLSIPFADEPSFENAMHCLCAALVLGFDLPTAAERLSVLRHVNMRLQLKNGINGCKIIDDTYNNDLAGIKVALHFLAEQHPGISKRAIISDIPQTGTDSRQWCAELALALKAKNIKKFIGIGPEMLQHAAAFGPDALIFPSTEAFLQQFDVQLLQKEVILVKGARAFALERVVKKLEEQVTGTVLEINLEALAHNLNHYRSKIGAHTRLMVMVKSLAYGAGSLEVAALLQHRRVDYLAVAYADEAVLLRQDGISLPIMVMNPSPDAFEKIVEYGLEPALYDWDLLRGFAAFMASVHKTAFVHLEFDTGMHRLGFSTHEATEVAQFITTTGCLSVAGVFSHLACADDREQCDYTHGQIHAFARCAAEVEQQLGYGVIKHLANTAGLVNFPEARFDMVRLGIGLYGSDSSGSEPEALRPVLTLKSVVSQVRTLHAGDTVGYNRKGLLSQPTEIATIAVGYGDGYRRALSNGKGRVNIKGKLCSVVGNVCMDMTMVDVTGLNVQPGDEVILFGTLPHADDVARAAGTIAYELFTGIAGRVKRVFVSE